MFFARLKNKISSISHNFLAYKQRYLWPLPKFKKEIVIMIDGVFLHGGLTDRFRNILSVYSYCKEHNLRFRIYYVYPLPLEQILIPNKYNWRINRNELSYSYYDTKELNLWVVAYMEGDRLSPNNAEINNKIHLSVLDEVFHSKRKVSIIFMETVILGKENIMIYSMNFSSLRLIWNKEYENAN